MNKKQQVWLPFLLGLTMSIGIYFGFSIRDKFPTSHFFSNQQPSTLQEVLYLINEKYVDEIDTKSIADSVIQSVISKLDPHSEYLTTQDLSSLNEQINGRFSGIGIEYDMFHDTLNITYVIPGGPAEKAGLKSGDQIIKVDKKNVSGMHLSTDSVKAYIKGEEGTSIDVQYISHHQKKQTTITRGNIELGSVDVAYMIDDKTGYIRLNKFSNQTYKEFMTSLMELKSKNMKGLVLDLRDNGGGVLDQAIEIADEFLSDDKLITYTEGKHSPRKNYTCKRQGQFENGPLVVLCNESTASASEVLMGALQDWDRATIVGQRSFGKGLVQEVFELRNQAALKLTIARYYTPTGRCIQRSYQQGGDAYYQEVADRHKNGYSATADSSLHDKGKVYVTPKGKKLFGGGGIAPDAVISDIQETMSNVSYDIYSSSIITPFSLQLRQTNSALLGSLHSPLEFANKFQIDDQSWQDFLEFAQHENVTIDSITPSEKKDLQKYIKASVGKIIWGKEGLFRSMNIEDKFIQRAREILSH